MTYELLNLTTITDLFSAPHGTKALQSQMNSRSDRRKVTRKRNRQRGNSTKERYVY
jgi:hypothetical protein